ncbi:outer membrane beta-barrel family protein [uncultured Kordia sp.]|uniref:outer membrane beta-barrel family protein n=1 Tax=uncultured Kordia sp. TaxID=507699 RepID=UPI002614FF11|nr:outer membrane beta-barrel family protein [uncultured Kordia sp.]
MKQFIIILTFFYSFTMLSQELTLSGTISATTTNEKLPLAAITVFDASADTLLGYAYSDDNGNYKITFNNAPFYVKVETLGYVTYKSDVFTETNAEKTLNINLTVDVSELDAVVILQKKRLIKMTGDKMIVDVDKSGLGAGNDALETLSKLPGMRLDKDENILFRGDGNLQILIDGKPSLLSGDALKQYLKTLAGDNIKAVEIIANPSAKYDAAGTGGILNIRLKKPVYLGFTGNVFGSVGYAEFIKNSYGLNLFNQTEKWNLNAGIYYGYFESVNHRNVVQSIEQPNLQTTLDQINDWFPISTSLTSKLGVSYAVSKNATLGTSWNFNIYNSNEVTEGRTNEFYNGNYERFTILDNSLDENNKRLTGNLYYSFASDSLDTKFDAQINYATYTNTQDQTTTNSYFTVADNQQYRNPEIIRNDNPTKYNILSTRIDYEKQLSDQFTLETGLKYSYVSNDYNNMLFERTTNTNFELDINRSNELEYKESIGALYGIMNYNRKNWSFQAGLRAEYIDYDATSITALSSNTGDYVSLFPSFSVNHNLDHNQFKFSYSRRIQRPRYLSLNPFFEYVDTYNVEVGNPNLQPQFTHSLDFTWVYKQKTSASIYAKFTNDLMDRVFDYDEETQITTMFQANIATSQDVGISLNTSLSPFNFWDIDFYGDFSYNHARSEIPNFRYDETGTNWYATVNQTFNLKNDWTVYWNSFYAAAGRNGNTESKPSYDMSFRVKKFFFGEKFRLLVRADNIFKTSRWRSLTIQDNVRTEWENRWEVRKFTLSLTYNFGSGKKKRVKDVDLRDEQRRL